MVPWAHTNSQPNGMSIVSAVFAQLTSERPYAFAMGRPLPSKLPVPMGDLDLHLIHD